MPPRKRKPPDARAARPPRAKPRKNAAGPPPAVREPAPILGGPPAVRGQPAPLPVPVASRQLVDFALSNNAILKQLALLENVCFRADGDFRDLIVDAVRQGLGNPDPEVRLKAASVGVRLVSVNAGVLKSLASDQLQRHLTFEQRQDERRKEKALDEMSVEEIEALEKLCQRMGGKIEIIVPDEEAPPRGDDDV
jgi:hypothetical protein